MRARLLASIAACFVLSCGAGAEAPAGFTMSTTVDPPVAVLAELFTSEGCSSCPPADDVLTNLIRQQPIPNVTIIGAGEHVDYWNDLGWRDVFSAPTFTTRQSDYERTVFHTGSVYTPQAVIDGRFQVVGSDSAALRRAIANAAAAPKAMVTVTPRSFSDPNVTTQIDVTIPPALRPTHPLDVVAAIVERNLVTRVQRGENGGRVLKHGAVMRRLVTAGTMKVEDRYFSKAVTMPLDAGWKRPDVQLVAFVQDRTTRTIVGVGANGLNNVAASTQPVNK
jgi:hypothetical protein